MYFLRPKTKFAVAKMKSLCGHTQTEHLKNLGIFHKEMRRPDDHINTGTSEVPE